MEPRISSIIRDSLDLCGGLQAVIPEIGKAARIMIGSLRAGCKVMVAGNGGSAADAQHIAAELVNRFGRERGALACIALTTDTSVLTSIGNDRSFDEVFSRQVRALGRPGDVLLGISTSGGSRNVVNAFEEASAMGIATLALTGERGMDGVRPDCEIRVPSMHTPRIQEAHLLVEHILCELVEDALCGQGDVSFQT
jgi:D-sedoheptulose 7-phosphate isomerase